MTELQSGRLGSSIKTLCKIRSILLEFHLGQNEGKIFPSIELPHCKIFFFWGKKKKPVESLFTSLIACNKNECII